MKSSCSTIIKTRVVVQKQQLCRLDREGGRSSYELDSEELLDHVEDVIRRSDAVILSDYAKGTLSDSLIQKVVDLSRSRGCLLAADPKPKRTMDWQGISLMTPNRREALQLAGIEGNRDEFPADEVCSRIYSQYAPRFLVVTLGSEGMLICEAGTVTGRIPAHTREVFDVSGAGDTVVACLAAALAAGIPIMEAAEFSNLAAGVVVGKLGTAVVYPSELIKEAGE